MCAESYFDTRMRNYGLLGTDKGSGFYLMKVHAIGSFLFLSTSRVVIDPKIVESQATRRLYSSSCRILWTKWMLGEPKVNFKVISLKVGVAPKYLTL